MTNLIKELKELKAKSTNVNYWYPHCYGTDGGTVRGPYHRWIKISEVDDRYKKNVASVADDTEYCAAAMNGAPELIKGFQTLVGDVKTAVNMIMEWQEKYDPDFENKEINEIKHHLMGSITDPETGNAMEDA